MVSAFASSAGRMTTTTPHVDPRFEPLANPWTLFASILRNLPKEEGINYEIVTFAEIDKPVSLWNQAPTSARLPARSWTGIKKLNSYITSTYQSLCDKEY